MKYNELQVTANKKIKRVGRGIAAGQGKTAGRGTKGQKARSGKKLRASFQGGSRSLVTATPKGSGFKSLKAPAQVVYLDHLNAFDGKTADNFTLFEAGLISSPYQAVKVILRGELTAKITLHVSGASKSVKTAVVKNGGTFVKTATPLKKALKTEK
ncbi:MAG: 50S ribosomal protein L15 [Candidatus Saccharibacteria bacterium]